MQGSLHDDLDAVTLIAFRAYFPAAVQIKTEMGHHVYVLFTLFLQSLPQGSHDPVPCYCSLFDNDEVPAAFLSGSNAIYLEMIQLITRDDGAI